MPINTFHVEGIEGLVEKVIEIAGELQAGRFLWFRGHRCTNYRLLPKLLRDGKPFSAVLERERRLIARFRQRSMAYWSEGYAQNDWEQLFAMQHNGLPTRLLDWSENLFVAAYFAINDTAPHAEHENCCPTVWCVDPIEWNRSTPPLTEFGDSIQVLTTVDEEIVGYDASRKEKMNRFPVAIFGAHNSARIVAQRGTFMLWGRETSDLEFVSANHQARIWQLMIDGNIDSLGTSLRHLGFSETMIFPELPFLAVELARFEGWKQ